MPAIQTSQPKFHHLSQARISLCRPCWSIWFKSNHRRPSPPSSPTMSTPLQQPTLLDSCDTTLRARRPSSLNLLTAVLPCFTANPSSPDDFNPSDDTPLNDTPLGQGLSQKSMCQNISPLFDAHMSGYTSKLTIPRHHKANPTFGMPPFIRYLFKTLHSLKKPRVDLTEENCLLLSRQGRLGWRLAVFLAYFM